MTDQKMTGDQKTTTPNGNTRKHSARYRNWFFTLNNPKDSDKEDLINYFDQKGQYLFQLEKGAKGTLHYQGTFISKNKISFTTLKKLNANIHWEKARNKKACIEYCQKDETFEGARYTNIKVRAKIKDPLKDKVLKPFQQEIINLIKEEPDDRKIYWYWDEEGNMGKTSLAKHICLNYNALYVQGKGNDIKNAVCSFIEKQDLDICIFGFPKSYEEYVSYDALESIKDGIFFNGKYESKMCLMNSPHIIVFSNFYPNTSKLSEDRWVIKDINPQVYEIESESD